MVINPGDELLSQAVARAVPSALEGLTAVSCKLVKRNGLGRLRRGFEQLFDAANGVRREKDIAADGADLGWHMVNHHHVSMMPDGVHERSPIVFSGASLHGAIHDFFPLCVGVTHFGGLGS